MPRARRGHPSLLLTALLLMAAAAAAGAQAAVRGSTILALYKSTEGQTERDNEIVYHLESALRGLGFGVRYHDLDRGLPARSALADVRAVVSWFRGPSLVNPLAYLEFIRDTIDGGRRYLVLDNLGAYQDRTSGRWLESGELNQTLSRFGLQYWGDWTDDPALVRPVSVDPRIMRTEALGLAGPRLYYRYIAVDRDLDVHLALERTDRTDGPSPVVVTNPSGGFALSTWLYRAGAEGTVLAVDMAELARRAIWGRAREERVLVVSDRPADPEAALALRLARNAGWTAEARSDPRTLLRGELDPCTVVVLSLGRPDALPEGVLEDYLERGGSVVSLNDALPPALRALAASPAESAPATAKGFRFGPGFLPSEGFFLEDREEPWSSGSLRPPPGTPLIGSDWLEEIPLAWSRTTPAGGTAVVWNTRGFFREEHAGFLVESVLAARPVSAALVPALGVLRLDGFPRPLYNTRASPTVPQTDTELYTRRVWPELRDMLARRGIPVSAALLLNYNDRTEPPFLGGEFYVAQAPLDLGRQIRASSGELGLLGYNHVSLTTVRTGPNPRAWPSAAAMTEALRGVRAEWTRLFGPPPRSYAAPYGILSDEGLVALRAAFPELVVAGTLVSSGGLSELGFGVHPATGIRMAPASSSGFLYTDRARRLAMSAIAGEGIWVHALDPDDVLDGAANGGKGWDELRADLDRMLGFVQRHYPWLRYIRAGELDAELDRREAASVRLEYAGSAGGVTTYLLEMGVGFTARLRYPGLAVSGVEGGEILYAYTRADAAVIRATSGRVTVKLARKAPAR